MAASGAGTERSFDKLRMTEGKEDDGRPALGKRGYNGEAAASVG